MMFVSLSPTLYSSSLLLVRSFIIIIIIGDCTRLHDPRHVRNRRNRRQSARRSDRLRFSRRETQNDRDPRFAAFRRILEASLGNGMVSVTAPFRATLGRS